MVETSPLLVYAVATFLLAGFVKGVIGLGLPTVAIGLLGLVMAPVQAAALLIVPALVTNIWQAGAGPHLGPLLHRLWPMLLGIGLGTWVGAALFVVQGGHATTALGVVLMVYAGVGLVSVRPRVPKRAEAWLSPVVGAATGLLTAITAVFVIPSVPYLHALALDRDELVQALGLSFTVSTLALAAVLAGGGLFRAELAGASLLALAAALAGMALGQRIRPRVRPELFRLGFLLGLLALGGHLALRAGP